MSTDLRMTALRARRISEWIERRSAAIPLYTYLQDVAAPFGWDGFRIEREWRALWEYPARPSQELLAWLAALRLADDDGDTGEP